MKKLHVLGTVLATGLVVSGVVGSINSPQKTGNNYSQVKPEAVIEPDDTKQKAKPICDGTSIATGCAVDGVSYKIYQYHPAVAEKSHVEKVTSYKKEITSYCTLCNDGTYSPSCATGSGACSHHGGVAEWNAPRYSNIPIYENKTIIDVPAQSAFYEKVVE